MYFYQKFIRRQKDKVQNELNCCLSDMNQKWKNLQPVDNFDAYAVLTPGPISPAKVCVTGVVVLSSTANVGVTKLESCCP